MKRAMNVICCRSGVVAVAALLLVLSAGSARGDGLLYQLPKDGAWATYTFDSTAKAGGQETTAKGTLRMASVGQVSEKDQACRWIEIQFDTETVLGNEKIKKHQVCKLLIPEKYLAKGQSPIEHVVRAYWQSKLGAPAAELSDPQNIDHSPMPLVLSGPGKNAKPLEKAEIEGPSGKLSCEGIEGMLEFPTALKPGGVVHCRVTNRLNSDTPFGVVSSQWQVETPGGTMEWSLKFSKAGEGAVSKLPDAK